MIDPTAMLLVSIVFGLMVGSLLNVCIVRLPEDESIVLPRSHCRACGTMIPLWDNVPLLSFLLLGGRCRSCGAPFSWRYPFVEALTGALFGLIALGQPPLPLMVFQMLVVSVLIVVTFIDIDHFLILDRVTFPTIALSPLLAVALAGIPLRDSLLGIAGGGGGLYAFAWCYEKLRHREGMGLGDVKLLAMIGGLLGWQATIFSLFGGALLGSLFGTAVLIVNRRFRLDLEIPFGPFLALGALLWMFAGPELVELWLDRA